MNFMIKSECIPTIQQNKQNIMMAEALERPNKVVINAAPTGFGKTHLQLALAKNIPSFIFTPTTNVTFEFYKAHQLQQNENYCDLNFSFLIGKAQRRPRMCPYYPTVLKEKYKKKKKQSRLNGGAVEDNKKEQSVYDLCISVTEKADEGKKCPYHTNTYRGGRLISDALDLTQDVLMKINSPRFEYNFDEIVDKINDRKMCPYSIFREAAARAYSCVCDFNYFIKKDFLKAITDDTSFNYALIDEFDLLMERLENVYNVDITTEKLDRSLVTLKQIVERPEDYHTSYDTPYKMSQSRYMFAQACLEIVSLFNEWIIERQEGSDDVIKIDFLHELETNEKLIDCLLKYKMLDETTMNEYLDSDDRIIWMDKLFEFFDSLENISDNDVVYYIEKDGENIKFERKAICFRDFYRSKMFNFNKILLFSATPPAPEILNMNFGDNYSVVEADWSYDHRKGLIYIDKDSNLGGEKKKWFTNWQIKADRLVDVLKASPVNENVVFLKSKKYMDGDPGKVVKTKCRHAGIIPFSCSDVTKDKEKDVWTSYKKSCKMGEKSVIFATAQGRWARGVNNLKGDGCRFLIIWGIPIKLLPNSVVQDGYNREFRRQRSPLNFWNFWCSVLPKSIYMQSIGRLVRGSDDYGFFVILTHKKIDNIINKDIQRKLGCVGSTPSYNDVKYIINNFFMEQTDRGKMIIDYNK